MNISRFASGLFLVAALCIGGTAAAQQHHEALVLGDSIAFSYIASVGYDYFYTNPENFIGFPDDLGRRFHLDVANGACKGETTGSFLSSTAPDNGCRAYRSLYPLHADYKSTQLDFATSYLRSHREVRLVTITLGANDGFLLEASCASNPTPLLVASASRRERRRYSPTSQRTSQRSSPICAPPDMRAQSSSRITTRSTIPMQRSTALTGDLNAAIAAPASAYGAVVADVFTAFQTGRLQTCIRR